MRNHACCRIAITSAVTVVLSAAAWSANLAAPPSAGSDELFNRLDANGDGSITAAEVPSDQSRLFARLVHKSDANGDQALSRDEFVAGLVPTRPEKKLEAKEPSSNPQADAVRLVLLKMDTSRNSSIDADEVPDQMRDLFENLADRVDADKNGTMDRYELSRGARQLGQLAVRYVAAERINVAKELRKIEKSQGDLARRFDEAPGTMLGNLPAPERARAFFKQLDANRDGKLVRDEWPSQLPAQPERLMRLADRDRDGALSEREFVVAIERVTRARGRRATSDANRESSESNSKQRRRKAPVEALTDKAAAESMPSEAMTEDVEP